MSPERRAAIGVYGSMPAAVAGLLGLTAILASCTQATVDVRADGTTSVQFTRMMTDAYVSVGEQGIQYSSSPSAAAQQQATDALVKALGALIAGPAIQARPAPQATAYPPRLASPEPPMFVATGASTWP